MVRIQPDPPHILGGVAQLGEHLLCKQGVIGSIPFTSTNAWWKEEVQDASVTCDVWVWLFESLFFNNSREDIVFES